MIEYEEKYRKDCYFYTEVRDMGGSIPTCGFDAKLGICPCLKGCKHYISNKDAYELVKKIVTGSENI